MSKKDEILKLKEYFVEHLYTAVRSEQSIDKSYIEDTFELPQVKAPHSPVRTGIGYDLVSAPGEQIVTNNPQLFVAAANRDVVERLTKETNKWINLLKKQNPNIFKETVKNDLSRGESYIKVIHNESWYKQKMGLPVHFLCPDAMTVYGDPQEDDCGWAPNSGVPNRVIVFYERQPMDVMLRYPKWSNPEGRDLTGKNAQVEWFEYWDKEVRFFEADGEVILDVSPNPYKFTPFVRKYSGFGKRDPLGKMEELIVSDIRRSRDLIREYTSLMSDISSILHIFAHQPKTFILPTGEVVNPEDIRKSLDFGSYSVNILNLPEGWSLLDDDTVVPSKEVFAHLQDIYSKIIQRHPFIMAGMPAGSSGRQDDLASMAAMRRYDTIVENTEEAFSTAFEMALKICSIMPKLIPDGVHKDDLTYDYKCMVSLKADDPIEKDRLAALGSKLYDSMQIDKRTNLVKYQGYTQKETEDIVDNLFIDSLIDGSPELRQVMAMKAAQKMGMDEEFKMVLEMAQQQGAAAPENIPTPSQRKRRGGETKTSMGREMVDMALTQKGQRSSPEG